MMYIDIATDHGAAFDGVTDDTDAWRSAVEHQAATGAAIVCPPGMSVVTDTILIQNYATAKYHQGPVILAASGPFATRIIAKNMTNRPVLKIDGRSPNGGAHFAGVRIEGLGFDQQSCVGCDAISYHSIWHSSFSRIAVKGASGAALRALNPAFGSGTSVGDNNASAHVSFTGLRVEECNGPAFDSSGAFGGITLHQFKDFYFLNNAKTAGANSGQIVLDGVLHASFDMGSVAAINGVDAPLIKIKATECVSHTIKFSQGEYGNNSGTHFDVDGVVGLDVRGIRQVRRLGENTPKIGFLFRNKGKAIRNIAVLETILAVDNGVSDGAAPFVWMKREPGVTLAHSIDIRSPSLATCKDVVLYEGF